MHRLPIFLLFFSLLQPLAAQTSVIQFHINGLKSVDVVMGYFQGGKAYRLDTVRVDTTNGRFVWQKKGLQPGLYFCSDKQVKLFEFMVTTPADSSSIFAPIARLDSLSSPNSPENEAFFRFEQQRKALEVKIEAKKSMRSMIAQATKNDPESIGPIDAELQALLEETDRLALDFMARYPNHLFARMLRSVRPPEPPKQLQPMLKNGKVNPEFVQWQRLHYWDNTDFRDESLLNNGFWQVYFDKFFSRFVAPLPDSLNRAVDEILAKTPRGGAFFRFIVLRITQYYEQAEVPGADRVFVHMVDTYQKKQETPWMDAATLERLAYKADSHRPNLTGSLAVNFTMPDENGKPVELYGVQAPFTILVFYSPLCSHCMEIIPHVYQTYLDYQPKGLAAIALNTDNQPEYWKKFVRQQNWQWYDVDDAQQMAQLERQYAVFNLPVIYLLDKDKRILAKKIKPNELGTILGNAFGKSN